MEADQDTLGALPAGVVEEEEEAEAGEGGLTRTLAFKTVFLPRVAFMAGEASEAERGQEALVRLASL